MVDMINPTVYKFKWMIVGLGMFKIRDNLDSYIYSKEKLIAGT